MAKKKCNRVRMIIYRAIDGVVNKEDVEHLTRCKTCRDEVLRYVESHEGIRQLKAKVCEASSKK